MTKRAAAQPKKPLVLKPSISLDTAHSSFRPTFNLGPGSVGNYFYPQTVGSSWKMKIVERVYDASNNVLSSDSLYNKETITSNSNKTFQGLPLLTCTAKSWRGLDSSRADSAVSNYYVDDSIIMAVFNNSINNNQNRVLLVGPLKVGNHWLEKVEDSARTEIVSKNEVISGPFGNFGNALVTVTRLGKIEIDKYFVPNVGIVKTTMRAPGRKEGETIVVTSELIQFVRGIEPGPAVGDGEQPGLPKINFLINVLDKRIPVWLLSDPMK